MPRKHMTPQASVLLAAVLFGASTPVSKRLLGGLDPIVLAGLLYLGAGTGAAMLIGKRRGPSLTVKERFALAGAVACGGFAAPIAMMFGLRATPAATASLLLNFEIVATALIAAMAFREALGRRVWLGIGFVTGAGCVLGWQPSEAWGFSTGAIGILAACVLWGLDNNLTRIVSGADPMMIVCAKGLGAGTASLAIAAAAGERFPPVGFALTALVLGAISFGLSVGLYVRALRDLGAARTSAWFGTAPFFGAALSWLALREPLGPAFYVALPLMGLGAIALLGERHSHRHHHPELFHDHLHRHDDGHHGHAHEPQDVPASGWHSHPHRHAPMTHEHPHTPDLHHRHEHTD
jgi:drug/metabolite transporter (DMT)-like permease